MATTFMDHLIETGFAKGIEQGLAKGVEQGIEQGIEKGVEQGLEKGLRQSIRVVLISRFGAIPPESEVRLAASVERLEDQLQRAATVASLREFFDAGPLRDEG